MNDFESELNRRLDELQTRNLRRRLREVDSPQGRIIKIDGRELLNFSSNDYLGLANHPVLREAAVQAIQQYGTGSGAARLICGSLKPHQDLEKTLADWKGTAAALTFSTGYATAVGTITALLESHDIIVIDKLVHACVVDGARMSGAKLRVFKHNDVADLESILQWADVQRDAIAEPDKKPRILSATESVFSMDGDTAPLREMVALKEKYRAWLMVDEAHATGLYGKNRCGLIDELGLNTQVEVQMGTLGKALGSSGGYICGSQTLVDYLVNRARSFVFSTASLPAAAAAAQAAIGLVRSTEGGQRCARLWQQVNHLKAALKSSGYTMPETNSAILPIIIGAEDAALSLAEKLRAAGFFVPAIRYPTVARGQARLRVTLTADHTDQDVQALMQQLSAAK